MVDAKYLQEDESEKLETVRVATKVSCFVSIDSVGFMCCFSQARIAARKMEQIHQPLALRTKKATPSAPDHPVTHRSKRSALSSLGRDICGVLESLRAVNCLGETTELVSCPGPEPPSAKPCVRAADHITICANCQKSYKSCAYCKSTAGKF